MKGSAVLRIITQRIWMVQELTAAMAGSGWAVQGHYGLSLPPADGAITWMPGAFATRLWVQGIRPALSSPGPAFLPDVSREFTGREVALFPAILAIRRPTEGFWKLADSKDDRFPAGWRTAAELAVDLRAAQVSGDALLHHTTTRLHFVAEFRAVVTRGRIAAGSFYTDTSGLAQDHPEFVSPAHLVAAALQFASAAAAAVEDSPTSYTLDVGFDRYSNRWLVVEANPIWSSAWYGCHLATFAAALITDQMTQPGRWRWTPDPVLLAPAARQRPLPAALGAVPERRRSGRAGFDLHQIRA